MIQPHESTQPATGHQSTDDSKTLHGVVCYLSLYEITRHYGGPEEGGWYYDHYEHIGICFPFAAEQDYMKLPVDEDSRTDEPGIFYDDENNPWRWVANGLPRVTDERTRVLLESLRAHVADLYDLHSGGRYSVLCGTDYRLVYENAPGEHATKERPHYE